MQKMVQNPWLTMAVALMVLLSTATAQARKESHDFVLYPGHGMKDPYVLTFPITVGRPGQIRVLGRITGGRIRKGSIKQIVTVSLKNLATGRMVAGEIIKADSPSFRLRYGVDSLDIDGGGHFQVLLVNRHPKTRIRGEPVIAYPVAGESEDAARPILSGLAIDGIGLDQAGFIQVTLSNRGQGRVAPLFWNQDGPRVMLYRNGQSWGGADLRLVDPGHALKRQGARVNYVSTLRVTGPASIGAEIRRPGSPAGEHRYTRTLRCR